MPDPNKVSVKDAVDSAKKQAARIIAASEKKAAEITHTPLKKSAKDQGITAEEREGPINVANHAPLNAESFISTPTPMPSFMAVKVKATATEYLHYGDLVVAVPTGETLWSSADGWNACTVHAYVCGEQTAGETEFKDCPSSGTYNLPAFSRNGVYDVYYVRWLGYNEFGQDKGWDTTSHTLLSQTIKIYGGSKTEACSVQAKTMPSATTTTTTTTTTAVSTQRYKLVDGCRTEKDDTPKDMSATCPETSATGAVRCCNSAGTSCTSKPNNICNHDVTWTNAEKLCAAWGGRLCTQKELLGGVCCGAGCSMDSSATWVKTKCKA
jgi:hypothetical protein